MTDEERQGLLDLSNNLFTASEALREALDTIDLQSVPVSASKVVALENLHNWLEQEAKTYQKLGKK